MPDLHEIQLGQSRLFLPPGQAASGPAVLFVHGAYHGAWTFKNWLGFFQAAGRRVGAVDLRGHGGLPQEQSFPTTGIEDYAMDVARAAAALGGEVILAGHSLGGLVAAFAAVRFPSVGLILLASSPPGNLEGLEVLPTFPTDRAVQPPGAATCRARFLPNSSMAEAEAAAARLCPESPTALNQRRTLSIRLDRARISGPALFLAAEKDAADTHAPGQDLAVAKFYGAEYHLVRGAGHSFMVETGWQHGAHTVLRWLAKNYPA